MEALTLSPHKTTNTFFGIVNVFAATWEHTTRIVVINSNLFVYGMLLLFTRCDIAFGASSDIGRLERLVLELNRIEAHTMSSTRQSPKKSFDEPAGLEFQSKTLCLSQVLMST